MAKRTAAGLGGFYVILLLLFLIYFFSNSPGHVSLLSAPGALRGKAQHRAQPRAPGRGVCACPRECVSLCACPCPGRAASAPRPAARLPGAALAFVAPQRPKSRLCNGFRNIF